MIRTTVAAATTATLWAVALCCAAQAAEPVGIPAPVAVSPALTLPARPVLKRKVAVGRFTNSTMYGKALLLDPSQDPLADQAADMLANRLVESGEFQVFERPDLGAVQAEQGLAGGGRALPGVDALVIGSVTEFGRKTEGKSGFLNSKLRQVASATVEVRLVDVHTGQAFFSTRGSGTATVEAGEVAGFGGRSGYDSTLNDKAISAAVSDLMTNVMQKLQGRRWFTDILKVEGGRVFMSGGLHQGLQIGQQLDVESKGETLVSNQSGLPITLPGRKVATVQVDGFFGDEPNTEGSVGHIINGSVPAAGGSSLIVVEAH